MAPKPNTRNWKDVQTAIATLAIVTTLGMWELFAIPAKAKAVQTQEPLLPPTQPPIAAEPTRMTQVKIMFTPAASPTTTVAQQPQESKKKKKKKDDNHNNNGSASVTQTQSS